MPDQSQTDLSDVTVYTMDKCQGCVSAKAQLAGTGAKVVNCSEDWGRCKDMAYFPTFKVGDKSVLQGNQANLKDKLKGFVASLTKKKPYERPAAAQGSAGAKRIRMYGADWCGWTKKAKAELDAAGVPYEFVDCAAKGNKQCAGLPGYPTFEIADTGDRRPGWPGLEVVKQALATGAWPGPGKREGYRPSASDEDDLPGHRPELGRVVVYGTSWCSHCKDAKQALTQYFQSPPQRGGQWHFVDCEDGQEGSRLCKPLKGYPLIVVDGVRHEGFPGIDALKLPPAAPRRKEPHELPLPRAAELATEAVRASRGHLKPALVDAAQDADGSQEPAVKVYGASWCGFTTRLLDDLKKAGIRFAYVECTNPDKSIREEVKLMNLPGFPVSFVAGQRVDGYDPVKIKALAANCDGIGCGDREGFGVSPVMGLTMDKQPAWSFYGDPAVPQIRRRFADCPANSGSGQRLSGGPCLGHWLFRPDGTADLRLE